MVFSMVPNNQEVNMEEFLKELRVDLMILRGNVYVSQEVDDRWEGMPERIDGWIKKIDDLIGDEK